MNAMKQKTQTVICPHCGEDFDVRDNGRYICPECENYVDVDNWFDVDPVKQPDNDSCGWATTLWLLRSFGALDVTPAQLRRELNTDARRGIRALWNGSLLRGWAEQLSGRDLEAGKGTLPKAIYDALSRRGIALKNPIRAESPLEFTDYLNETFDEGGRAAILIWRGIKFMHWMGAMRKRGRIRIMDPATGTYEPFVRCIRHYGTAGRQPHFLVFGFVRD